MSEPNWEAEQELKCLMQALENYSEVKSELKQAQKNYTGYSPGYHLISEIDAVSDAAVEFGNYLGKVIDRRVEAKLKEREPETYYPKGSISKEDINMFKKEMNKPGAIIDYRMGEE